MVVTFYKWTIAIEIFRLMDKNIKKYQNLSDFNQRKNYTVMTSEFWDYFFDIIILLSLV